MKLEEIVAQDSAILIPMIGSDVELAIQIQTRLSAMGLLDPPADGKFGPVSHWALAQLLARLNIPGKRTIDKALARVLLDDDVRPFPMAETDDLAGRLVATARKWGYWLCRHPDCVNILYVEGADANGVPNQDAPNAFNDLRLILRITRTGKPVLEKVWEATTEPGAYYVKVKKLHPRGAARIAFGQYKAWVVGTHMKDRPSEHEALVQVEDIKVFRDLNEDFERLGDEPDVGLFGVNQHSGYDMPKSDIGRASAGCLVGRTKAGHRQFMDFCKSDARYQASRGYRFVTAVLSAQMITR